MSLMMNVVLIAVKAAAMSSGSLSVLSSLIDSSLDVFSSIVMWCAATRMRRRHHAFPVGKSRYAPLSALLVACVMGTAAAQVVLVAIQELAAGPQPPIVDATTIGLLAAVIVVKAGLFMLCRLSRRSAGMALAQDHASDTLSNTVAMAGALLGARLWASADQLGAIIVSLLIMGNWLRVGLDLVKRLAGRRASPQLTTLVAWVAVTLESGVQALDTVRVYTTGDDALAEVDIVLDGAMALTGAHAIGDRLQAALERIPGIERAFVHLDVDTDHAADEHKDVYVTEV